MPYQVRVEKSTRTIVITGTGSGTTADTLDLIASQRDTFRENSGYNLIYDSSAMQIDSNPADMVKVADELFEQFLESAPTIRTAQMARTRRRRAQHR